MVFYTMMIMVMIVMMVVIVMMLSVRQKVVKSLSDSRTEEHLHFIIHIPGETLSDRPLQHFLGTIS
jgi:cytochrome bd-type quinol oxidase subunit 1